MSSPTPPAEVGTKEVPGLSGKPAFKGHFTSDQDQEHENLRAFLSDWMLQQRKLYADHISHQERLLEGFLSAYTGTRRADLRSLASADVALEPVARPASSNKKGTGAPEYLDIELSGGSLTEETTRLTDEAPKVQQQKLVADIDDLSQPKSAVVEAGAAGAEEPGTAGKEEVAELDVVALGKKASGQADLFDFDSKMRDCWIRCSGIHTVEKWVKNYRKHPAGWAALLMIHGIPEVTGRLRSKVENYAIYSALFLSVSIGLLTSPPSFASMDCPDSSSDGTWWECQIRKRLYLYLLAIGTATHMLSIMLGMSFINALNEAARDSDIYRMFSRGKGFLATVKSEKAFGIGCIADFLAMVVSVQNSMGWDALPLTLVLLAACARVYFVTSRLLFVNASLVNYWRSELGGKPDEDDPYDLATPVSCFNEVAKTNRELFMQGGILAGSQEQRQSTVRESVWDSMRAAAGEEEQEDGGKGHEHKEISSAIHKSAVAALF